MAGLDGLFSHPISQITSQGIPTFFSEFYQSSRRSSVVPFVTVYMEFEAVSAP